MSVSVAKKPWSVKGNAFKMRAAVRNQQIDLEVRGKADLCEGLLLQSKHFAESAYFLPNRLINEELLVSDVFISILLITGRHDQGLPGVC